MFADIEILILKNRITPLQADHTFDTKAVVEVSKALKTNSLDQ